MTLLVTFGTFTVSAFWHGFYPFYYFMFFMCGMMVELSKEVYRARALFDWVPMPNLFAYFFSMLALNFLGTSFNLLTFERGGIFGQATNYYVFILIPLFLVIFKIFDVVGMAKRKEKAMADSDVDLADKLVVRENDNKKRKNMDEVFKKIENKTGKKFDQNKVDEIVKASREKEKKKED